MTLMIQGLLLGALLPLLSSDVPDFKGRMLTRLKGMVSDHPSSREALAKAIGLIESL